MNLAAIDLGSNAVRLLIKKADLAFPYDGNVRKGKDYFLRVPVGTGLDVYSKGIISEEKIQLLIHTLKQFQVLMAVNQVEHYRAYATATFRDARNGREVADCLYRETNVKVEIISGDKETALSRLSYYAQPGAHQGYTLFADVGGGSTDVCLSQKGESLYSHSFHIGSLRMVSHAQTSEEFTKLDECLTDLRNRYDGFHVVGCGGNIRKFCSMFSDSDTDEVNVNDIQNFYNDIRDLSLEEKMERYSLTCDRAEIIAEAANIFLHIAHSAGVTTIQAPNIGVRDGIIVELIKTINNEETV